MRSWSRPILAGEGEHRQGEADDEQPQHAVGNEEGVDHRTPPNRRRAGPVCASRCPDVPKERQRGECRDYSQLRRPTPALASVSGNRRSRQEATIKIPLRTTSQLLSGTRAEAAKHPQSMSRRPRARFTVDGDGVQHRAAAPRQARRPIASAGIESPTAIACLEPWKEHARLAGATSHGGSRLYAPTVAPKRIRSDTLCQAAAAKRSASAKQIDSSMTGSIMAPPTTAPDRPVSSMSRRCSPLIASSTPTAPRSALTHEEQGLVVLGHGDAVHTRIRHQEVQDLSRRCLGHRIRPAGRGTRR